MTRELVNRQFTLKERLKEIDESNRTKEEKIEAKRALSIQINKVKTDLLSPLNTPFESEAEHHTWLHLHKPSIVPKTSFKKDSIYYDLKASTMDYLPSYIYVCRLLEPFERYVQAIPIRTSNSPSYITIDNCALVTITGEGGKRNDAVETYRDETWDKHFRTNKKEFRRKDYTFHHQIKTDGVGVSIVFRRADQPSGKTKKVTPQERKEIKERRKEIYVHDLPPEELVRLSKKKKISCDPGVHDLGYFTNGKRKKGSNHKERLSYYRYSSNQRRVQTKRKKYRLIRQKLQ
jgi:hypothetical protein